MILSGALNSLRARNVAQDKPPEGGLQPVPDPGSGSGFWSDGRTTKAKQVVTPETSKSVATFYRGANILSDDVAAMPLQMFRRVGGRVEQVQPDAILRNIAYLIEVSPNRWMTPFIFKKTVVLWQIFWGNGLIWSPPSFPRELFILPANLTRPLMDKSGDLWYEVIFPNGKKQYIPEVEVLHLMINSTNGIWGRSILEYARETLGRQLGAYETQSVIQGQGLNPAAYMHMEGTLGPEERKKVRDAYEEAIGGSNNAGRLAVFDRKVQKFDTISMKLTDAQFLESINATDKDLANFLGLPEYKLNSGKQSYESNTQHDIDYLKTTLDPTYLVQWEQAARLTWLTEVEQRDHYFKFVRESILRTDPKTRAELNEVLIRSGQRSPDECREKDDYSAYPLGERFYMSSNNVPIEEVRNAPE